jgi:putative mRNA 3-end processing factor
LAELDASIGPIVVHGAVEPMVRVYRESRVMLPATVSVSEWDKSPGTLAIAPPSADGTPWLKRFQPCSTASASGWMQTRASKRQRNVDRGFVLSDHADWPGLLEAVKLTGAETVLATHGFVEPFTKHLRLQGLDARTLSTRFGEEEDA